MTAARGDKAGDNDRGESDDGDGDGDNGDSDDEGEDDDGAAKTTARATAARAAGFTVDPGDTGRGVSEVHHHAASIVWRGETSATPGEEPPGFTAAHSPMRGED